MSDPQSNPSAVPSGPPPGSAPTEAPPSATPASPGPEGAPASPGTTSGGAESRSAEQTSRRDADPLRGSRASGIWVAVLALVVVIILLSIFIAQNTQTVQVSYLGWSGSAPLSATLLIAAAGGALLVAAAGALRILQLRHRFKKARKRG